MIDRDPNPHVPAIPAYRKRMARNGWSSAAALVLTALLLPFAPSRAGQPPAIESPALEGGRIRHGKDVSSASVGPAAAGYRVLGRHPGAVLKDGGAYPFAKVVGTRAAYDGFAIDGPHLLIEGAAIEGGLDIYTTKPVVLRGSSVRAVKDGLWSIHQRPGAGPLYLLWSEAGGGRSARVGIGLLLRSEGAVIFRSHISGVLDGLRLTGHGYRISQSLIDGLVTRPGDHNDGIQTSPKARDITIERSRIMNQNPQTSSLLIRGSDIRLRDSYLAGGGWTLYGGASGNGHGGPSSSGLSVTGNIFGRDYFPKSGRFGPVTYWSATSQWSGNTYDDGLPIEPPRR
jgi:hypothetical protein